MLHKNTTIPCKMINVQLVDMQTGEFIDGDNYKSSLDTFLREIDEKFRVQGNYMQDFTVWNDIWDKLIRLNLSHDIAHEHVDEVFQSDEGYLYQLSIY